MKLILFILLIASPMVFATDFDPNFSSDFGIVIQDEQTLTIKNGVSNSSFVNVDTSIKLKLLHLKKGSRMIVDYSAGHTRIEALEATFDEGSSIIVKDKDSHKVGDDGYPSPLLTLVFPKLKMNGVYLKVVGGDGSKGAKGKNAGEKKCSSGDGWPAGNGRRGGVGGNGGNNNNIVLYTSSLKSELNYTIDFVAGKGGEGGIGGQGGDGASGKTCLGYKRGSRPPGKAGPQGPSGKKGEIGQFIVINITS